jgi:rhomboid protease GluP
MNPETPAVPFQPTATFPIDYQTFAGREYNRDLKGSGTLALQAEPLLYRFTGRKRGSLTRETVEREFSAAEIFNVEVAGRRIRFSPGKDSSGRARRPFVFYAAGSANALQIAALMPRTLDPDFVAARDFGTRLRQLPSSANPLLSVTGIIVALNVAVFIVMAGFLGAGWVDATDLAPYIRYGANNAAATTDGQWWRLLTSMFMHFGILHLALNMWALLQSGRLVERLQGRTLYAITYLASGLGGGFLSMAWHGTKIWSAGASGAIFGVYGALLGYMLREKQALPKSVFQPLLKSTLLFAGYNLVYGLSNPAIDNGAHIGGLVTGFALGWLTAPPLDPESRAQVLGNRIWIGVVATVALIVLGVATAPRYDFSLTDEYAWNDATKNFDAQAQGLEEQQYADLRTWVRTKGNDNEFRHLLQDTIMPFYAKFARDVDGLQLSPGKRTDRRRKAFSEFAHLRLESYDHLLRALADNDSGKAEDSLAEYQAYANLDKRATEVVQAFARTQKPVD